MTPEQLRKRTKEFALRILRMYRALPRSTEAQIIGRHVLRSAMSVAANYRSVNRSRSRPDFVNKIGVVLEEIDETVCWLEMLVDGGIVPASRMDPLLGEANELLAIFAASQRTAKTNKTRESTDPEP